MYHQLVFIWVRDPAMFAEYLRNLPPIVARYGGAADLSLRPTAIWADGLTLPDVVNLVHYDDAEAFQRFGADADFRRIEPLRAGSVDLMTFEGYLSTADPSPAGSPDRLYRVEVAANRTDEARTEARMREYGCHVEYVLEAETAPTGRLRPDLIRILSFRDQAATAAFDADSGLAVADDVIRLTAYAIR